MYQPRIQSMKLGFLSSTILTAVGLAALPAHAQTAPPVATSGAAAGVPTVGEVVVTASRRSQSVVDVPYNISAVGGAQLARAGATNIANLSQQIPNFTLQDYGGASATSSVPIIRGLNASAPVQEYIPSAQAPVGSYIGNSPYFGYFPLDDIQRVEVLRGPQGTLYGAGSLAGTVRVIPNDPSFDSFSGKIGGSGGLVAHSGDHDYSAFALLNIPLSETLAIRANYKYEHEAGFIDQFGIMAREGGNYLNGLPILTNPQDVANSTAVRFNKKDVNFTDTQSGRVSLLWKPTDKLRVELAYNYSYLSGNGGPVDNPTYGGGVNPIDGRTVFPATGNYQIVRASLEPYSRTSHLASADISYDLGFATLSSTSTYNHTAGSSVVDQSKDVYLIPAFGAYYLGNPINPRFQFMVTFPDFDRSFTQEVRLVSKSGGPIEYVGGVFYQTERRGVTWYSYLPGSTAQAAASGGTPIVSLPNGQTFTLVERQKYSEISGYGELTWHVTKKLQVTGGARIFSDDFSQSVSNEALLFDASGSSTAASKVSSHILKFNASYEYLNRQRVYATFSQGFRRPGANGVPLVGLEGESPEILQYASDRTNNYEVGLKGRLPWGMTYTIDGFYVDWTNPQIETSTPVNGWPVVINAPKARSEGFEFESSGPLVLPGLSYAAGFAYTKAELTRSFCLPAGDGLGGSIPCGITASAGDRLPGTPKTSATVTLNYEQHLQNDASITYSVNANYRGSIINALPNAEITPARLPGYTILNASAAYAVRHWEVMAYAHNLLDKRALLNAPTRTSALVGNLANIYTINRPREVGVQLTYNW